MTLDTLANDIAAAAEKEAKALIADAQAEAKKLHGRSGIKSQHPSRRSGNSEHKKKPSKLLEKPWRALASPIRRTY
jgi:vacuolar-type H+-ATPase subunit E/Vma4